MSVWGSLLSLPLRTLSSWNDTRSFAPAKVRTLFRSGISDQQWMDEISGNAQHRKRFCSLFHGTFLLNFDSNSSKNILAMPSRQPDYRRGRSHEAFLCNLSITPNDVRPALKQAWGADETLNEIPVDRIKALVRERYSRNEWNFRVLVFQQLGKNTSPGKSGIFDCRVKGSSPKRPPGSGRADLTTVQWT
jgi:hypothetical protein